MSQAKIAAPLGPIESEGCESRERIRLLKFITLFAVGGTEQQVVTLAKELDDSRFELHFGCLKRTGQLLDRMDKLERAPLREYRIDNLYNLRAVRERIRFASYLRRNRIQIVHSYNFYPNMFVLPAARLAGVPVVIASIRDMGAYLTPARQRAQQVMCRLAHSVVANAEAVRQWLVVQGYQAHKITVIPNGIDPGRFALPAGASGLRQELGLPPACPLIAAISRLSPSKGLEYFLQAARVIAAKRDDAHFLLVGEAAPWDRGYGEQLAAYVDRLGLTRRVIFTGLRLDVPRILSEITVSVLPSLTEGLSNVLLESMAAGVPVVATRVGGNPEAVEDEVTGLLVPPRDPGALATAILRMLDDRELATRFGLASRRLVAQRFSIAGAVRETERLYCELLQGRQHAA
ncbi:MAG: hypothetical protein C5B48_04835 [Candidatus Rokuibacteriota bacterium]|nr:MAG: hypothetical protein C5B48_04835 [Candidatus Rokubacteria bacterium]